MKRTCKIACLSLMAAAVLSFASQRAQAQLTGTISFYGNVTAYNNSSGGGGVDGDLATAKSLVFGSSYVAAGANGSFDSITVGTPVSVYSPLQINPPVLPTPSTAPLWQVTSGITTYALTLSKLTEPVDTSSAIELTGSGIISNGTPADSTPGTWVATFTSASMCDNVTFSWNASSATVPEPASVSLLGIGAVGLLSRRRKRIA